MLSNKYITKFIDVCLDTKTPGLIMSVPGVGKTTTMELYCDFKGYNLTTLIASQYSSDDLLGIQSVVNGELERLAPYWYTEMIKKSENGKPNVLFIDEITTCDEFVQAPLLNLIFNQSLGKHRLPENTYIMAAGNYAENLNNAFSLSAPLVNRFLILNLDYGTVDYNAICTNELATAKNTGTINKFLGLNYSKDMMYDLDKVKNDIVVNIRKSSNIEDTIESGLIGFTSPRSISYAINFLDCYATKFPIDDLALNVVGDTLGRTTSNELFRVHLKSMIKKYTAGGHDRIINQLLDKLERSTSQGDKDAIFNELRDNAEHFTETTYKRMEKLYYNQVISKEQFKTFSEHLLAMTRRK